MSDVLIKGMKMPRTCAVCEWSDYLHPNAYCRREQTTVNIETAKTSRPEWCPLISVPTPHGRLIDADAFDERVRVAGGMSEEELTEDFKDGVQTVLYMLSKQPPIIEADVEDAIPQLRIRQIAGQAVKILVDAALNAIKESEGSEDEQER